MTRDQLRDVAQDLRIRWNLEPPIHPLVPFDDPRDVLVEYVCHELAHAALLRLMPRGKTLSDRVEKRLEQIATKEGDYRQSAANELETFMVVMRILKTFDILSEPYWMARAAFDQVGSVYANYELIYAFWRRRRSSPRVRTATQQVLQVLLEEADL